MQFRTLGQCLQHTNRRLKGNPHYLRDYSFKNSMEKIITKNAEERNSSKLQQEKIYKKL